MLFSERMASAAPSLTDSDRRIGHVLTEGYPRSGLLSATAIARKAGTSAASVVRLIAKLGYAGWADFQSEARAQIDLRLASPLDKLGAAGAGDPSLRAIEAGRTALNGTVDRLDPQAIRAAVLALTGCRGRVVLVGEKKGRAVALYLFSHLNLCLERVQLLSTDAGFSADVLMDIGPDDVALVVDVRRYVDASLKAARWAVSRGARLIALCDSVSSPLWREAEIRLVATTEGAGAFDTYVGLLLLADVLTTEIIAAAPEMARTRMVRGERAWTHFATFGESGSRGA